MIPVEGSDPAINVVSIGAKILEYLKAEKTSIDKIIEFYPLELKISVDHIILSLDWLFTIGAISTDGIEVFINETN